MIKERLYNYNENHCWQYNIRLKNISEDVNISGLSSELINSLRVSDFIFMNITDKFRQKEIIKFIEKHEWLGTISPYTTHYFGCYYFAKNKGMFGEYILAGAELFNMPNAFSKLLGEETKIKERLISRGACISWSPKNLASSFLMWCIKWMVDNTSYRLFTAYSDVLAKELGVIYQACNFYYLGVNSGATKKYYHPYHDKMMSDRWFRTRCAYKNYAKALGIEWDNNWLGKNRTMVWDNVPNDIELQLRDYSRKIQFETEYIIMPRKHKYAYVLGRNKYETRQLRKLFESLNKTYSYPKERGK